MDWEDLRHFVAVARAGTLSGAARSLKVDHATVSRRLAALEADVGVTLVDRLPRACRLTHIGRSVLERAMDMEAATDAISRIAKAASMPLVAKVTLSAPPVLVAHLLARHLAEFRTSFPNIRLSLAAQAQQVSLSRREADVALRLTRPQEAGSVARRIGTMPFAFYAHREYSALDAPDRWQFIGYDQSFAEMPQQKWLLANARQRPVVCELNDISGHLIAAQAKAGVAGLPCFLGDAHPELKRLEDGEPGFSREIWLVAHKDLRNMPSVRAVMEFVTGLISRCYGLSC